MIYNPMNAENLFRISMLQEGISTNASIIGDGNLHRFHVSDDKNCSHNGWYVLFLDGVPSGAFGSWKTGVSSSWCAKSKNKMTYKELIEYRHRINEACRQRDRIKAELQQKAAARALQIWSDAKNTPLYHPYLLKKRITPHNLRQINNRLLVPLVDLTGNLRNLQMIDTDGSKRFLYGGRVQGVFALLDTLPTSGKLYICEGWATATSIRDITACTTVAAMNAGNLKSVAKNLRLFLPSDVTIIIAADNDRYTPNNPGLKKAKEAAETIGARITWPRFNCNHLECTDFNDLANCDFKQGEAT